MTWLPEAVGRAEAGGELILNLELPATLAFFPGHFPGVPILPGVIQVYWAIHFARTAGWADGEFEALEQLKFNALIRPGDALQLRLSMHDEVLHFHYSVGAQRCASGRVRFRRMA